MADFTEIRNKPIDDKIWALNDYYASQFANISSQANLILERYKARMNLNYLVGEVFTNIHLDNQVIKTNMIMPYIESCIKADPQIEIIKIVDEDWCILSTWHLLHIQDIVKVLNNYGKPLHYRAITNFINLQSEKSEKVIRHHIRRILQRRPDFFVLYEHGTFGLVEWGIARSPTILYYLYEILKLEGNPLSIDEIYGRIKELLFCGRTSIIMCLTENNYFVEFQLGMYGLREWVDIKKQGQET